MQRISGPGAVLNKFVHEDVNISQEPTEITADWMNSVQEELATVVEGAGLTLDTNNNAQVIEAIASLIRSIGADNFVALSSVGGGAITEDDKWAALPIGYTMPYLPAVMGTDITIWLAAHPSWDKVTNTIVADIEGRAFAIKSSTHAANTQSGSDDAIVVSHDHTASQIAHAHGVTQIPHTHPAGPKSYLEPAAGGYPTGPGGGGADASYPTMQSALANITINSATPAITVALKGVSGVNKNIQRTVYLDWIYKKL